MGSWEGVAMLDASKVLVLTIGCSQSPYEYWRPWSAMSRSLCATAAATAFARSMVGKGDEDYRIRRTNSRMLKATSRERSFL